MVEEDRSAQRARCGAVGYKRISELRYNADTEQM
jgi:hypothetical protein